MTTYIAIVRSDRECGYTASFPDFPGCVAEALALEPVIAKAREALALHIERLLDADQKICSPTPADRIDRGDASVLAAIDVPDDIRIAQIELAIPALSLVRIDSFAGRHGLSRSALFVEAVNRWSMQETVVRERRSESSDGPTLFDFENPLELRVDKMAAEIDSATAGGNEADSPGSPEDITAELARLFEDRPGPEHADGAAEEKNSPLNG